MRQLIKSCLQTAHSSSRASIAIPAIGTGNLKVPPDVACWVMYDEVDKFSQNNAGTPLRDVRFVVYDKDPPSIAVCWPLCVRQLMLVVSDNAFAGMTSFEISHNCQFLFLSVFVVFNIE